MLGRRLLSVSSVMVWRRLIHELEQFWPLWVYTRRVLQRRPLPKTSLYWRLRRTFTRFVIFLQIKTLLTDTIVYHTNEGRNPKPRGPSKEGKHSCADSILPQAKESAKDQLP